MATFVICHGAWDGGWYWQGVARKLQKMGHVVYTPTLTGLGEREHLGNPATDLETHIQDLVNVFEYEDLKEVSLVGHSYGGAVITGAVDRISNRLSDLIYLDAFILKNRESLADLFGNSPVIEHLLSLANQFGDGWRIPFHSETDTDPRHAAQPMQTFFQKLNQTNPEAWAILRKTYISCTERGENPVYEPIEKCAKEAKDQGWPYFELSSGHNPNDSMPDELSNLLNQIVS